MDIKEKALIAHEEWGGKIEVISRAKVENKDGIFNNCFKLNIIDCLLFTLD